MFAGIIFQREPFFKGEDNNDQLFKIVRVLGSEKFEQYLDKYQLQLDHNLMSKLEGHKGKPWDYFAKSANLNLIPPEALDFLDKLLRFDHAERILP